MDVFEMVLGCIYFIIDLQDFVDCDFVVEVIVENQ